MNGTRMNMAQCPIVETLAMKSRHAAWGVVVNGRSGQASVHNADFRRPFAAGRIFGSRVSGALGLAKSQGRQRRAHRRSAKNGRWPLPAWRCTDLRLRRGGRFVCCAQHY